MSEFVFLSKIYKILNEEGIFEPDRDSTKYVDFKQPRDLEKLLDLNISEEGIEEPEIDSVFRNVVKNSVKNNHPCFQNELYGGYDPYSLASSWVTDAVNNCQFTYEAGPVFTLIENYMIKKLLEIMEFPADGDGVFCAGSSQANMYGLVMARQRHSPDIRINGLYQRSKLIAYTSEDGHYSIGKAVNWLGFGLNNVVVVKCNSDGTMCLDELEKLIEQDIEAGNTPFFVNATAGTTVLGAMDDIPGIAEICKKFNIWLHVDATLGGHLKLSRRHSYKIDFKEADSIVFAPQKTLGTGLQCAVFLVKDKDLLSSTNSCKANYLFRDEKLYDTEFDIGDKSIQCGRRIDSFKLWMLFKSRGTLGVEKMIDNAFDCAKYFKETISKRDGFRLVIPKFQYTNICFWYIPRKFRNQPETDEWWKNIYQLTKEIKEAMQLSGKLVLAYNSLEKRNVGNFLRLPIKCCPPMNNEILDYIIEKIEWFGENV